MQYDAGFILEVLEAHENGLTLNEIVEKFGISDSTFYNWKRKYKGANIHEIKTIRELKEENKRLKIKLAGK